MPNLGTTEWIIIGLLLVLLFGSKKLADLARGLGESSKELKKAKKELEATVKDEPVPEEDKSEEDKKE